MVEAALILAIGTAALGLSLLGRVVKVPRCRLGSSETLPVTAEWIDHLSVDRYRPMLRLLDEKNVRFLRCQPGYTLQAERHLRTRRAQLFRGYLNNLQMDFSRICLALQFFQASALPDHRVRFTWAMAEIRLRLMLYRLGLGAPDGSELLRLFDSARADLRVFVPAEHRYAA